MNARGRGCYSSGVPRRTTFIWEGARIPELADRLTLKHAPWALRNRVGGNSVTFYSGDLTEYHQNEVGFKRFGMATWQMAQRVL